MAEIDLGKVKMTEAELIELIKANAGTGGGGNQKVVRMAFVDFLDKFKGDYKFASFAVNTKPTTKSTIGSASATTFNLYFSETDIDIIEKIISVEFFFTGNLILHYLFLDEEYISGDYVFTRCLRIAMRNALTNSTLSIDWTLPNFFIVLLENVEE